jgi:peroxiredoxin Q/BCP
MKIILITVLIAILIGLLVGAYSIAGPVSLSVKEGDPAPDFTLADQEGKPIRLSDFRGRSWVVLYFYPKDDTPGCTKEACSFRDNFHQIQQLEAVVLGVSVDSVESHRKFSEKFHLNFPILSDSGHEVSKRYGVLTRFMGIKLAHRSSFIIDPHGMIRKIFPDVKATDHAEEVIVALRDLKGENERSTKVDR